MTAECRTCDAHHFGAVRKIYFAHLCLEMNNREISSENLCPPGAPDWCPRNVNVDEVLDQIAKPPTGAIDGPRRRR